MKNIFKLFELYLTFFKIGCTAFGGGYTLLPIIQKEIVEKKNWATNNEIIDYFIIGQCTPGIISINISTFIGYKNNKTIGSIFSTLGFITPSIIIITIISKFISNFSHIDFVKNAFTGIRVCVCVLIFNSLLKIWNEGIKNIFTLVIFLIVFFISILTKISPVLLVIFSALMGIIIKSKDFGEYKK